MSWKTGRDNIKCWLIIYYCTEKKILSNDNINNVKFHHDIIEEKSDKLDI